MKKVAQYEKMTLKSMQKSQSIVYGGKQKQYPWSPKEFWFPRARVKLVSDTSDVCWRN